MFSHQFRIAHFITKGNEGFVSDDVDDPGGYTVLGLTKGAEPKSGIWPIVERFKKLPGFPENMRNDHELHQAAMATYEGKYWTPLGLDAVKSGPVYVELFDAGVNIGPGMVMIYLKLALNSFNKKATLWPDFQVDSKLIPAVADAINTMCGRKGEEELLYKRLNAFQDVYYTVGRAAFMAMIDSFKIQSNQDWRETFERGWSINRVISIESMRQAIADADRALCA